MTPQGGSHVIYLRRRRYAPSKKVTPMIYTKKLCASETSDEESGEREARFLRLSTLLQETKTR
jgi:hypothetical protein